jgi:hypothetical protein
MPTNHAEKTVKGQRFLEVRVYTRSSKPRVEEMADGTFRVYVCSVPEKGKANADVVKAMAEHLGVRSSVLQIVRGLTSRQKLIRVDQK